MVPESMTSESKASTRSVRNTTASRERALECARAALDKKAENVRILDLTQLSGFTEFFVICSGMSDRQVQAIASSVEQHLESQNAELLNFEGFSDGRWVLMDFGDVVVHIFQDALRDYYDLENLWADAPRVAIPAEFYGVSQGKLN
jgi:ribosome-associated protein